MSKINRDLSSFKAIIFDVDGVLSKTTVPLDANGVPCRTVNVRDGYAIKNASDKGITLAIISGGYSESIPKRYEGLGMKHIYMQSKLKTDSLDDFISKTGIKDEEIIFVGDDLPDIHVMERVGLAVAPKDAAPEVKQVADYISPVKGGNGVARDIIEELLKAKGLWMTEEAFGW